MNIKAKITLLLTLIFFALCWNYYVCNIKGLCNNDHNILTAEVSDTFGFLKGSDTLVLDKRINVDSLCQVYQSMLGYSLIFYRDSSEDSSITYRRLTYFKSKFTCINWDSINIGHYISKDLVYPSVAFSWKSIESKMLDSAAIQKNLDSSGQSKLKDSLQKPLNAPVAMTIYFDYNATKVSLNPMEEKKLKELCASIKDSNASVLLEGHTDKTGNKNANKWLSNQRAENLKSKMQSYGVSSDIISISSVGDEQPAVKTSAALKQNRRVEIKIQ
ncbi:MAG: OmpA family protein [Chitinophagales bacterium]|jgi:outer membrane protein OmpA-like peptidoglycan-associated protein|nr:OmpA family protein [Chitinophagales bacterium]